jgi:hypothetical protein
MVGPRDRLLDRDVHGVYWRSGVRCPAASLAPLLLSVCRVGNL